MQILGTMIIFLIGGMAMMLTNNVAADPMFITAIAAHSPWIAKHSVMVGYIASGILWLGVMAIPPVLMMKDANDGGERLETIGLIGIITGKTTMIVVAFLLLIPSISYLVGMGWFAAQQLK